VQGLIHDIPTVAELIQRIVREARDIISSRLLGVLNDQACASP
jgi:NADH:quinone reductase (non-electrogenic)